MGVEGEMHELAESECRMPLRDVDVPEMVPERLGRRAAAGAAEVICQLPETAMAAGDVGVEVRLPAHPARTPEAANSRQAPACAHEGRENR